MRTTIKPENVTEVLLRGESDWQGVQSLTAGFWRLEDGTKSTHGRRGWIIVLDDGTQVCIGVEGIEGVR
jgi:hypothetical protein